MASYRKWNFRLAGLAAMLLGAAGIAQGQPNGGDAITAHLIAEHAVVVPGETVTLALTMTPKPGWHGYWKNPGDSGMETQIAWDLPAGIAAGPLQYPVPDQLIVGGLMNYVYDGEYALLVDVAVPGGLPGTKLPVRARVNYLACTDEVCVPETANVAIDLKTGAATKAGSDRALFDRFRAALPKPLGSEARFETAGSRFRLAVPVPADAAIGNPHFYGLTDGALSYAAAIGRFLEKHGRTGVPLYLYYRPGEPVEVLPQVLTPSRLVSMVS